MKINKASAWAELLSSIAVVVTLVVLVFEVRATNVALERQAAMDRVSGFTDAFFEAPVLADVLAKIKAVDGTDPIADELMARYGLTSPEAIIWGRHLWVVWSGIEADFMIRGDQPEIRSMVAILKASPDNEIYLQILDYGRHEESFVDYVNAIEPSWALPFGFDDGGRCSGARSRNSSVLSPRREQPDKELYSPVRTCGLVAIIQHRQ